MTIQTKAIAQYFHVVLFNMLYKVVQTFKSVDETLVCDHSNESSWSNEDYFRTLCGTLHFTSKDSCADYD